MDAARLPDFLIVGAARCGTSWLATNMAGHPDVFMPRCKEVHFFDRHYKNGIDWYRGYFAGRTERLVGEATPAYLYFQHIPPLVRQHVPSARILAVLRDPVDRAYSHYWNLVGKARRKGEDCEMSFEEKLEATPRIVDEGLYVEKLERYYLEFSHENIKVLFYDDLVADPAGFLRDVCRFLGIDQDFESPRAGMKINASGAKLGAGQAGPWLHGMLARAGLGRFGTLLGPRQKPQIPPLSKETRAMLLDRYYTAEIERLERMFDRDLSSWKR